MNHPAAGAKHGHFVRSIFYFILSLVKLYLSSYFFGAHAHQLPKLVSGKKKVAIIMNAGDIYGNERRPLYFNAEAEKFNQLGFKAEELDLRDYFHNRDKLETVLDEYGLEQNMSFKTLSDGEDMVINTSVE